MKTTIQAIEKVHNICNINKGSTELIAELHTLYQSIRYDINFQYFSIFLYFKGKKEYFFTNRFVILMVIYYRFPVVSVGVIRWVECTVTEPSYFKLCTEHCPVHLALLDEVVVCHPLLHPKILRLLVHLFESKQDELEILVQVSISHMA